MLEERYPERPAVMRVKWRKAMEADWKRRKAEVEKQPRGLSLVLIPPGLPPVRAASLFRWRQPCPARPVLVSAAKKKRRPVRAGAPGIQRAGAPPLG